jgi:hypothetical protein
VAVAVGAVASCHFTLAGHVIALPSPLISTVNAHARPDAGGLVNDTVVAPEGVNEKVVPVDRSKAAVPDPVVTTPLLSKYLPACIPFFTLNALLLAIVHCPYQLRLSAVCSPMYEVPPSVVTKVYTSVSPDAGELGATPAVHSTDAGHVRVASAVVEY